MRSPACCSGEQEQEEGIEEAQGPSFVDGWPESSSSALPEGGQAILADPRLGRRGRPGRQRHRCGLAYSAYAAVHSYFGWIEVSTVAIGSCLNTGGGSCAGNWADDRRDPLRPVRASPLPHP